jgi:hypothetical protein
MEFDTPPELLWHGIDTDAFNLCSDQLNFKGIMQQRWLHMTPANLA